MSVATLSSETRLTRLLAGASLLWVSLAVATPASATIRLEPHRATYELVLDGSKPAKNVNSAQGKIVYELRGNECTGYSVQLSQSTDLDTEGGRLTSALTTATWEDGDGESYRFRVANTVNDDKPEEADGVAERRDGHLVVKATKPETETIELSKGILLPTQHMIRVIEAASRGETLVDAPVYDGSPDARKVYDTLSVIGRPLTGTEGLEQPVAKSDLAGRTRYPVTISYYERGSSDQAPDYTISFDLYENGVSRALKLDYGDFSLKGTLISYEALPKEACPN